MLQPTLDSALGVGQISFKHVGKLFSREIPFTADWFEMEVLDLVNDALAASKVKARFIPLPTDTGQVMFLGFVPPEIYQEATKEKLLPKAKDRYLAELLKREQGKQESNVDKKLLAKFRSKDWGDRSFAVYQFGQTRAKATEAFSLLLEALEDENDLVRKGAADALARVGKPAIPALEKLLQDKDASTRAVAGACNLLKIQRHAGALTVLTEALHPKNKDEETKDFVLHTLAEMGKAAEPVLPALIKALDDPSMEVRDGVFNVLKILGPMAKPAIAKLVECVRSKQGGRWNAVITLGCIGPTAAEAVPELIEALTDKSENVRAAIATALGRIGPAARAAVPSLVKILRGGRSEASEAAESLEKIGPPAEGATPALLDLLKDKSVMVRTIVARALAILDPKSAKKAVPILIKDYQECEFDRDEIAEVLRRIDSKALLKLQG